MVDDAGNKNEDHLEDGFSGLVLVVTFQHFYQAGVLPAFAVAFEAGQLGSLLSQFRGVRQVVDRAFRIVSKADIPYKQIAVVMRVINESLESPQFRELLKEVGAQRQGKDREV